MKALILISVLFASGIGQATTPEYIQVSEFPRLELTVAGGVALQTGYLTTEDSAGAYSLGFNFGLPGGIFSFDWSGVRVNHDTNEFALANNKRASVESFSFIPFVKVYNRDAFYLLLGIGFSQISLMQFDPDYATTYGTFTVSALARYHLNEKWSLQYKTSWYSVNQIVNDQKTSFEVWSHLAGVAYNFN